MSYTLSKAAEKDIEEIIEYSYANFGHNQAEKYRNNLNQTIKNLSQSEYLGKKIDYTGKNLRKYIHQSHAIYYEIENKNIFIIRVLHNKRNSQNLLN